MNAAELESLHRRLSLVTAAHSASSMKTQLQRVMQDYSNSVFEKRIEKAVGAFNLREE